MKYGFVKKGIFIKREKRFIGYVNIDGTVNKVHIKQTGRCKEILIPGVIVFVEKVPTGNTKRKTEYTLIAVIKPNGKLVNIDSQIPNKVFMEALKNGLELPNVSGSTKITPESVYGNSRFDFKLEEEASGQIAYVEVKGVTLEENGVVLFPDAPTERGLKHVKELVRAAKEGYGAYIIFIVQINDVKYFSPNMKTHPEFGHALKNARENGVKLLAFDSIVTKDFIELNNPVEIVLNTD